MLESGVRSGVWIDTARGSEVGEDLLAHPDPMSATLIRHRGGAG